ncbi:MAG: coproporphyrinogen dehydrogenase HemZ [Eubacteriales bacterium]|nr:coproporphyrinogen dehydrogenase HemZ [Eubacteriales bacterium]
MIIVTLNEDRYAYDIHSLVKAFYPEQEVKVFVEGTKEEESSAGLPALFVDFKAEGIRAGIRDGREKTTALQDPSDRVNVKNELKRLLYGLLSEETGKCLPWGTLTGIRPTRIAMQLLEQGKSDGETERYMRDVYLCSAGKASLSVEIARREQRILSGIHYEEGYSLYIGIPFCPTTCLYCSFTSFPIRAWKNRVADYLTALEKEIDFVKTACAGKVLDSVYIGGGTPTTLEPEELERLLSKLKATLDWSNVREFTVEAGRADSITAEKLRVLKRFGVTRISVNPQTMKQETLDIIGRRHTVEQAVDAFLMARREGFDNINMDLILGLPGESLEDVDRTIRRVKELSPDSLTVHSLAIKRASRLSQWILENSIESLHNTEETMEIAARGAREMGMEPYYLYRQKNMSGNFENVGYARPGKAGIYNILIMEEKQSILALGAGTISKAVFPDGRIERCDSVKDVGMYIGKVDEMIERKRRLLEG